MEKEAQAAEALAAATAGREALDYAIQAAELYMRAASNTPNKQDAARFRRRCRELIAYAEKLKTQLSNDPTAENGSDILQKASLLHGNEFQPWDKNPSEAEFQREAGQQLFIDRTTFSLSPVQTQNFAAWQRPQELVGISHDSDLEDLMRPSKSCNLVQDVTTDCSVVASLSAAIGMLTGKHAMIDYLRPELREHYSWLTEEIRGSYGQLSSKKHLWVLTGWIPEQLFLQREDFDLSTTWRRIKAAHETEDVVVTLGTGRISSDEEEIMGLVGEHDYAVLDMDASDGIRKLLIKNPWCNGPVWTGAGWSTPQQSPSIRLNHSGKVPNNRLDHPSSGTLWVAFEDVAQHFESMYLNWNPSVFPHRQDRHFNWNTPPKRLAASLVRNAQYSIGCPRGGLVWILISRHFVDQELGMVRNRQGSMAVVAKQLGYMSILIFETNGERVQVSGDQIYRGPYVDSPQTLARLETEPGQQYTVVLDQQELPLENYNFTLTVFSELPVELHDAQEDMSHCKELEGSWSRRTAGGNSSLPTYFINPQYKLSLAQGGPVSILLTTDDQDVHVHVDLVWASGKRVTKLRVKELAGTSGEYRQGCAVAYVQQLDPGVYTLICSTFEANQTANYNVRVTSMTQVDMERIPADAAGRLRNSLASISLSEREERVRAQIKVSWLTRGSICVRSVVQKAVREDLVRQPSSLMIRVYVVHGWGPERLIIAQSGEGEFLEPTASLRTPEFDIEPEKTESGDLWLVLETIGMHSASMSIDIDVFSDSPVLVGLWESW
ncbi:hypothetical protein NQ176_g135 [Zarea fungicola]|uniref:Uncharacterized protein n=1 Tax=Zarea fungicola TaxID=93591 RepID=A0ACC1NXZ6_9HYPO|nr:hypothetical protein NQ176_g135 [Lecanicillium fungicola]